MSRLGVFAVCGLLVGCVTPDRDLALGRGVNPYDPYLATGESVFTYAADRCAAMDGREAQFLRVPQDFPDAMRDRTAHDLQLWAKSKHGNVGGWVVPGPRGLVDVYNSYESWQEADRFWRGYDGPFYTIAWYCRQSKRTG